MAGFIKQVARKILPLGLKKKLAYVAEKYDRGKYIKKLNESSFSAPDGGVFVSYGGVIPRGPGAIIQGGRVKLIELDKIYPERSDSFNILYLVSSALSQFCVELAQWAKSRGVKIVWNQNGVAYPAWAGENYSEINRQMKSIIHIADYVFYQSEFCRVSANTFLGEVSCPWQIAYNYVDTNQFAPIENPPAKDIWRLLSAGSHLKSYRALSVFETVAELIKRRRKIELTMAGPMAWEGALSEIETVLNDLGIKSNVKFTSSFARSEAPSIFHNSHILLHTKYNDPCPTIPIEAMSCGVPVVGSGNGGMPELVSDMAGILVDIPSEWDKIYTPDHRLMADAVERIMTNWEEYSVESRKRVMENFGKSKWLDLHKYIFKNLVNL